MGAREGEIRERSNVPLTNAIRHFDFERASTVPRYTALDSTSTLLLDEYIDNAIAYPRLGESLVDSIDQRGGRGRGSNEYTRAK